MKRLFKTSLLLAAVVIAFGLQSCTSVKPIEKTKLEGYWTLKTLKGEDAKAAFEGSIPNFEFNFSDSTIAGNGGCNGFGGKFSLSEENEFSAPNLIATMKMCFDANKEPLFLSSLSTPNVVLSLDKDGLLTFTKDNEVLLQFEKAEKPAENAAATVVSAESLVGKWNLTSIADGDIATLFKEKVPTMEIDAEGKVFGNAGCNTYRTAYELNENTITFKPAAMTMMTCPSMEGEAKFTTYLTAPLQVAQNGEKLTFSKDGNIVLEFAKSVE
ncbi:MAG: META domain-containing protein [Dysgonomonas sp.]|nr:META domain-containing protein [Dysgonomonas sp.]